MGIIPLPIYMTSSLPQLSAGGIKLQCLHFDYYYSARQLSVMFLMLHLKKQDL